MTKKFDLRYGRERELKRAIGDDGPPPLYRADLLAKCRDGSAHYWDMEIKYPFLQNRVAKLGIEFRDLAAATGLSTGTIQSVLKGEAAKLESVKTLANYFGIPWLKMFDLDDDLEFDKNGRFVGKRTAKRKK